MDVLGTLTEKSGDHVIPQMVVTSADNEDESGNVLTETCQVPEISREISSADGVTRSTEDANSPQTIQEMTRDGNVIKDKAFEETTIKKEMRPEESAVHTAIQRPLIIETEKCVSQSASVEKICPPPPPPPESPPPLPQTSAPTTMQRPLVFEGSSPPAENNFIQDQPAFLSQELHLVEQGTHQSDGMEEDSIMEILPDVKETKPKSHSFSWIPKLHAHEKESKNTDVHATKKDPVQGESQNLEESEAPAKKDGLQNMKKFFDNLLHDTSSDSKDKPKVTEEVQEVEGESSAKKVPKEEKQSYYKKIFGSSKSEHETVAKDPKPDETQVEIDTCAKESSKDSKYNVKKMFDSFKHDVVDKKESSKKISDSVGPDIKPEASSNTPKDEPGCKVKVDEDHKDLSSSPKESSKDSKYNIKKMFDSFKHDVVDKKESTKKVSDSVEIDIKSGGSSNIPKDEYGCETKLDEGHKELATSPPKESKLKKMFDSFKHDVVDKKESAKKVSDLVDSDIKSAGSSNTPKDEYGCETKLDEGHKELATSPPKESKLKKMFDSFKHDGDKKESPKKVSDAKPADVKLELSHSSSKSEFQKEAVVPKEEVSQKDLDKSSKDPPKDSKYNLKKMLDSFSGGDKKESSKKVPEASCSDIKTDTPIFKISSEEDVQNELDAAQKEKSKDSKYNIKKMFDSFKHDEKKIVPSKSDPDLKHTGAKPEVPKISIKLQSDTQNQVDIESKEISKDPKSSPIKKMFDSFKQDVVDKKDNLPKKESSSHSDSKSESSKSPKDSKSGLKKFFDSLKHEGTSPEGPSNTIASGNIQSLDLNQEKETIPLKTEKVDDYKDPFCKDVPEFELPELSTNSFPSEIRHLAKTQDTTPKLKDEKVKQKDQHGVKKLLSAFKQDHVGSSKGETAKFHVTFMEKENSLKRSHSFKDSILLKDPEPAVEGEKKSKDAFHGMKKYFSSSKQSINQSSESSESQRKPNEIKRSQSCRETAAEKEGFHIKSFFDSLTHKKTPSQSPVPPVHPSEEHIYDVVGKPDPKKYPDSAEEDLKQASKKVKSKDDHSGVKKLFDSFMHKDQSPKPKASEGVINDKELENIPTTSNDIGLEAVPAKSSTKESVTPKSKQEKQPPAKLVDNSTKKAIPKIVKPPSDTPKPKPAAKPPSIQVSNAPSSADGKTMFNTFSDNIIAMKDKVLHPKDSKKNENIKDKSFGEFDIQQAATKNDNEPSTSGTYKPISDDSFINDQVSPPKAESKIPSLDVQNKSAAKPPSVQVSNASGSADGKTMFNTFSDNIIAMKDKVLHPKDSKKNENIKDKSFGEFDIQQATTINDNEPSTSGTYKPISDDSIVDNKVPPPKAESKIPSLSVRNKSAAKPKEPVQKPISGDSAKPVKSNIKQPTISPGTPETLYETCCIRLAVLLGKKAIEIVSDQNKNPPKKPPKPTAEAIAKARAEVVSRRLREIQFKGQSIGESIPVGYDGIRFADEETESSCDYKDVDNFDYIMDYELINRYKCDSKLDTFSDPSTCSGISSYYTADTVTLKDENFSDAPLETISLNSNDSHLFQNATEVQTWPSSKKKNGRDKLKAEPTLKEQRSVSQVGSKLISQVKSPGKKIPPPIPPKPVLSHRNVSNLSTSPDSREGSSACINGLSLSPRLQSKFSKDGTPTRQRPLLVAGFKGTEFSSLKSKPKDSLSKQPKDRKFNTVLKNESLKTVSTISDHKPLQSSKSSPGPSSLNQGSAESPSAKKATPQRPPLPNLTQLQKSKPKAPPVPEKPKREGRVTSPQSSEEKRTVSPPRPPPPVVSKISSPPPRPPPPVPKPKPILSEKLESFQTEASEMQVDTKDHPSTSNESRVEISISDVTPPVEDTAIQAEDTQLTERKGLFDSISSTSEKVAVTVTDSERETPLNVPEQTPQVSFTPSKAIVLESTPKAPPRFRRIRSRTVEIVPKEKDPELNLRRSQSLSDIEVNERTAHLDVHMPTEKADLKNLYTSVNKDGKRTSVSESESLSLEKVSSRPLPAPPPPPRKFRSLDRKPKEKKQRTNTDSSESKFNTTGHSIPEAGSSDFSIKPPERKKKADKQRFHSLSIERKAHEFQEGSSAEGSKSPRSCSAPSRPDRRPRHDDPSVFDENGNVSFPIEAEVHHSATVLDECGNEVAPSSPYIPKNQDATDSKVPKSSDSVAPHPRLRRGKNPKNNPKTKSHSSWYDEYQPSEESWEVVDWDPSLENTASYIRAKLPPSVSRSFRRKSDPSGSRTQSTSRFYVNIDHGEGTALPLLDKETSPLPIDCSEKSVQTSLETLSQGIVSHDDKSESSDNTDNLLNIVKTLQSELKVTLNRHKSFEDENDSSSVVGTDSEKLDSIPKRQLETPSVQSSTSDVWPITSSDDSDGETAHDGSGDMSEEAIAKKKKKIFYIAQEIMTSEEVFVDTLKLLNVDFKAAVEDANKQKNTLVIPEEILGQILNHLPQLQHLNENLLMELKDRIDNWDKSEKIADVIVKMGPFLKLYSWFIHDFESNLSLLEDSKRKYPLFSQVVKEFEASPRCKRLTLNHYMLKPIQRIPQYRLLLQEYLHHLSEESPDYQDTVTALQIVSDVANHANESMKHGDNAQKLVSIQNSIIGHREIIKPGRLFLKEGVLMKLSRKGMQPRWFVLFNDLLLYLTPVQQGLYRVNHDLSLTGMKVAIPIQQDYQHEFSIISAHRSFSLAARSLEEREEWILALTKAIKENTSKRKTFTNVIQEQSMLGRSTEDDGEFVLGKEAPVWIPDDRVTMCQLCTSEFTVTFRRHHCRACGKVICSVCSSNRIPLHYCKENKVKRVCDECYSKLGPGGSPENLETDSDNQQIAVKPHHRTDHRYVKKGKRNLPSVLKEVCANDQGSTISGYLQKRLGKSWKKEWFVVKEKVLYEYRASEDVAALKSTPLLGYQIESFTEAYENVDSSLLFQLTHPGQAPIIFHADSIGSTERWIAALKEATVLE